MFQDFNKITSSLQCAELLGQPFDPMAKKQVLIKQKEEQKTDEIGMKWTRSQKKRGKKQAILPKHPFKRVCLSKNR